MNFTAVSVSNSKKIDNLSKNRFFFKKKESKNLSAVHSNTIDDLRHVVFNIEDEYIVTTSKRGPQFNFPYSSLINTFYQYDSNLFLIEHENSSFDQIIIDELTNELKIKAEKKLFINNDYLCIHDKLNGKIKKMEYTNADEEFISRDYVDKNEFYRLVRDSVKIEFLTINFEDRYLSVKHDGKITIDNNDEKYLLSVVSRLFECIG